MKPIADTTGGKGRSRQDNASLRLEKILAERLGSASERANRVVAKTAESAEAGFAALQELDQAVAQAMVPADLQGEEALYHRIVSCHKDIIGLLSAPKSVMTHDVARRVKDNVDALMAAALHPRHEEAAEAEVPLRESKEDPDRRLDVSQLSTLAVSVALTGEEYDVLHEDEDADLIGFFLESLTLWVQSLQSHLPKVTRAEGKSAYEETVGQLEASANYLDIWWIRELLREQRTALQRVESAEETERQELFTTLAKGAGRLSLLLGSRDQALKGVSLAESVVEAPEREESLPPEFNALVELGRTFASIAMETRRAQENERPELQRRLKDVVEAIQNATVQASAYLDAEATARRGKSA